MTVLNIQLRDCRTPLVAENGLQSPATDAVTARAPSATASRLGSDDEGGRAHDQSDSLGTRVRAPLSDDQTQHVETESLFGQSISEAALVDVVLDSMVTVSCASTKLLSPIDLLTLLVNI